MRRLREGPVVLLAWAALVALPGAVTFLFDADLNTHLLFAELVAGTVLIAIVDLVTRRRARRDASAAEAVPDVSVPSALLAVGLAELVLGAEIGPWLLLIGAGTVVIGGGAVIRELRDQRAVARAAAEESRG